MGREHRPTGVGGAHRRVAGRRRADRPPTGTAQPGGSSPLAQAALPEARVVRVRVPIASAIADGGPAGGLEVPCLAGSRSTPLIPSARAARTWRRALGLDVLPLLLGCLTAAAAAVAAAAAAACVAWVVVVMMKARCRILDGLDSKADDSRRPSPGRLVARSRRAVPRRAAPLDAGRAAAWCVDQEGWWPCWPLRRLRQPGRRRPGRRPRRCLSTRWSCTLWSSSRWWTTTRAWPRTRASGLSACCLGRYARGRWTSPTALQCLSRRMTRTRASGSWTTTTWRQCSTCTSASTPRRSSWAGTAAGRPSAPQTWRSMSCCGATAPTPSCAWWTSTPPRRASPPSRTWRLRRSSPSRRRSRRAASCTCRARWARTRRRRLVWSTCCGT
mmetsp:Transcript_9229/g.28711  ORF Transcript_9229/g.28711 Transcript_9229/m.28711 type:complete len:386 (+) Transcript_9229:151-1308(+)